MIRRAPISTLFPYTTLFRSGVGGINVYGTVGDTSIYRVNALAGDPNHLGVILCVPLLTLLAVLLRTDRKSTRLNSSHANISYAVFCLKKNWRSGSPSIRLDP